MAGHFIPYVLQTDLGDPSSDGLPSSTSVTISTGTDLPNVVLLLCSAIPDVRLRHQISRTKGVNQCIIVPVVLPQSSRYGNCVNLFVQ